MKILKFVGALVAAIIFLLVINFPKTMATLVAVWTLVGIAASFAYSGRRSLKNWRTVDTYLAVVFAIFGPLSLVVLKSKDPRL